MADLSPSRVMRYAKRPTHRTLLLTACLIALSVADARAQNTNWWDGFLPANAPDARVHSMLTRGDTLYCAGQFNSVASIPAKVAAWSGSTWSAVGTLANATTIEKLGALGGQLVAVGNSISPDGVQSSRVAILSGSNWTPYGSPFPAANAVCVTEYAGTLAVGGSDGQVYRWTGSNWLVLGSYGSPTAVPRSLIMFKGSLFVGGDAGIRRWDGAAWQNLGSGVADGGGPGTVFGMSAKGDSLLAVGTFTTAGGTPAANVAAWDGSTWHALGAGFNSSAYDVLADPTGVYASGPFATSGATATAGIARFNGTSWEALGSGIAGPGFTLAALEGSILVGGSFTMAGSKPSQYVARWTPLIDCNLNGVNDPQDIALGTSLDCNANGIPDECDIANGAPDCNSNGVPDSCEPDCDGDGTPDACESQADCNNNGILDVCDIASGFSTDCNSNGVPDSCEPDCDDDGIPDACEPNESWSGLGGEGGPNGRVHTMAVVEDQLFSGGQFVGSLASWNGTQWSTSGLAANSQVEQVVEWRGRLVALGYFTVIGGVPAPNVAQRIGTTWVAIPNVPSILVRAATTYGGDLVYGSDGDTYRWDGTAWSQMGTGGASALCTWNGVLYRGNSLGVDRWNGTTWENLATADTYIWDLAVFQSKLYAIGTFTVLDGQSMAGLAVWDSTSWNPVGSGLQNGPSVQGSGYALHVYQNRLYAAGTFTTIASVSASGVAAFDGTVWQSLGTGLQGVGWSLATYRGSLYVGGLFSSAGGVNAPMLARWGGCTDCNNNGVDDRTEIQNGSQLDVNGNGLPDSCDIASGGSTDCNQNGVPDEIEPDCDGDGIPNTCEPFGGGPDCNANGVSDGCDIASGASFDCNQNGVPDECEPDCDEDGIPDACEPLTDCNNNGIADNCDIASGTSQDCDANGVPDECQPDCDNDGLPNSCEPLDDCDADGTPDHCEIALGAPDCDANGVPDSCQVDANHNGLPDVCDIASGRSPDCNNNGIPDSVDVAPSVLRFEQAFSVPQPTNPSSVAAVDMDSNGLPDVVVTGGYGTGVHVVWSEGAGAFTHQGYQLGGNFREATVRSGPAGANLFLMSGGYPDFGVTVPSSPTRLLAVGDLFHMPSNFSGNWGSSSAVTPDRDVIWLAEGGLVVIPRNVALAPILLDYDLYPLGNVYPVAMALADVDRDGITDVLVVHRGPVASSGFTVLRGDGLGHFGSPVVYEHAYSWPASIAVSDVNHDLYPDVIIGYEGILGSYTDSLVVSLNLGNGTFGPPRRSHFLRSYSNATAITSLAVFDVDADGHSDVVGLQHYSGIGEWAYSGKIGITFGSGDGTFSFAPADTIVTLYARDMAIGDFDGDDRTDLAVAGDVKLNQEQGNMISIFLNRTTGLPTSEDLNGDWVPDECQTVGVPPNDKPKGETRLLGAASNPIRTSTPLGFVLAQRGAVELSVLDVAGRVVKRWALPDLEPGTHEVIWDGRGSAGEALEHGMYFLRMRTHEVDLSRKIVYAR